MPLFDNIGKKITVATQNVVRGTKEFTDTARLNSLIADEQQKITALYSQIGKLYYESAPSETDTAIGKLCHSITSANERIDKYNEEIRQIKGVMRCPACGADIAISSIFCGACGTRVEVQADKPEAAPAAGRFCTGCGAEIPEGVVFCTSCGQKIIQEADES